MHKTPSFDFMKMFLFDTETTGLDVEQDRIWQFGAKVVDTETWETLDGTFFECNPGVPMSPEAVEVHGRTTESLVHLPPFSHFAHVVLRTIEGCDLIGGYNVAQFDIPILVNEFKRCGLFWQPRVGQVRDALQAVRKLYPQSLEVMTKFLVPGFEFQAHDAGEDVRATAEITKVMWGNWPLPESVDLAGHLVIKGGVIVFGFGKFKGEPVRSNAGYARWMLSTSFPEETKSRLREILAD
jgi:DNA polymerase-3 subunit epsilon